MSSAYVDKFMQRLANRIEKQLGDTGEEVVADLAILCSEPWPPPSRPGKPPHARSGDYARGWYLKVVPVSNDQVTLEISNSDKRKLRWLERGTKRAAARPVLDKVHRKWGPKIKQAIKRAMNP